METIQHFFFFHGVTARGGPKPPKSLKHCRIATVDCFKSFLKSSLNEFFLNEF
jgi:hypothetical protein